MVALLFIYPKLPDANSLHTFSVSSLCTDRKNYAVDSK